jgi:hypothetical protein
VQASLANVEFVHSTAVQENAAKQSYRFWVVSAVQQKGPPNSTSLEGTHSFAKREARTLSAQDPTPSIPNGQAGAN